MHISDIRSTRATSLRREGSLTTIVTGGAGFLGSSLCRALVDGGHRVICIDSLITGRLSNIADLLASKNFRFIEHDVIDVLDPGVIDEPVQRIYNLACPASPNKYQANPVHTLKTSVIGSINMLEMAREKGARILQASTSEVYGDPKVSPQTESYFGNVNTIGPRSCYDEGKRAAESLFHDYNVQYGVETKIARIFNTYGPGMDRDDGRVVSNFIVQALEGRDLTVYGNGTQTRSFCYVGDMIVGLVRLMESAPGLTQPVNLGNPDEFTVLELAQQVLGKVRTTSKIVFTDLPIDDPCQRKPDISTANRILKWSPKTSLDEGLDLSVAFFSGEVAGLPVANTAFV